MNEKRKKKIYPIVTSDLDVRIFFFLPFFIVSPVYLESDPLACNNQYSPNAYMLPFPYCIYYSHIRKQPEGSTILPNYMLRRLDPDPRHHLHKLPTQYRPYYYIFEQMLIQYRPVAITIKKPIYFEL